MAEIKALIFDQDGVIIDTERDGHRMAFNQTFKEFGYDFEWDVEKYHELLRVSGGKERMRHYLHTEGFGVEVKPEEEDALIKTLHRRKTAIFIDLIESGKLPLRPGVKRLMQEAMDTGLTLGICTTSNERAAHAVAFNILKDVRFDFVLAGDVVSRKKPDPEIYNLALEKTGLEPEECVVIEDSRNGVLAATAAGMRVVATTNVYTERENLSEADIVVTCLGDPDGEKGELKQGGEGLDFDGVLHIGQLIGYFSN
jgi:HAD superfamily hydrolase (TIGR01509 family)